MGFPNVKKESNTLNASVFTKFRSLLYGDLHSVVLNSAQFSDKTNIWNMTNSCWWRSNMQNACCPFDASLLFENVLKKRVWSWTLWIEINLVAYRFWHEVCCIYAPMQWNRKVCFCHWQVFRRFCRVIIMFESCHDSSFNNKFAQVGWNLLCKQCS